MSEPEVKELSVIPQGMLANVSKDEIDMQIATAKRYPRFHPATRDFPARGVADFQNEILQLATIDEETARSMFYRLERRSKFGKTVVIEGPSVRMAEVVASCWRNLHIGSRVAGVENDVIVGQSFAWDLENNLRVGIESRRRITDRDGRRFNDDMINTTGNAAIAIALRNAVFKVVPGALMKKAMAQAKEVSTGKGQSMEKRRERIVKLMVEVGAKPDQVLAFLERKNIQDVTVDDLIRLNGLYTAIKDGETTWKSLWTDFQQSERKSDEKVILKTDLDDAEVVVEKEVAVEEAVVEEGTKQQSVSNTSETSGEESGADTLAADDEMIDQGMAMSRCISLYQRLKLPVTEKREIVRSVWSEFQGDWTKLPTDKARLVADKLAAL